MDVIFSITQTISGEESKSQVSSLCSSLHYTLRVVVILVVVVVVVVVVAVVVAAAPAAVVVVVDL
jgi:CHASE3 domain sensor protein